MRERRRTYSTSSEVIYEYGGSELLMVRSPITELLIGPYGFGIFNGYRGYWGYDEDGYYTWIYYDMYPKDIVHTFGINEGTHGQSVTYYIQAGIGVRKYENGLNGNYTSGFISYDFIENNDIELYDPYNDFKSIRWNFPTTDSGNGSSSGMGSWLGTWSREYNSSKKLITFTYTAPYYTPDGDGYDSLNDFQVYLTYGDNEGYAYPFSMRVEYTPSSYQ